MTGSTFTGTPVTLPPTVTPAGGEPVVVQRFCTVADLVADMQAPGADEAMLYQRIKEASEYLQKEIGWFIPVTMTRKFNGHGRDCLIVPPLLWVDRIVNAEITLVATDYLLHPVNRFWANGPYGEILVDPDEAQNLGAWEEEEDGVEVTGGNGLYNLSKDSGANVGGGSGQDSSQLILQVDDGSKVSAGMALLIGSEQELVTGWSSPIDSSTTLNGAITSASEQTLTLADATKVNIGEVVRLDFEQMKVLDKQSNQIYVARGWNKTAAVTHLTGIAVYVYRIATVERAVNGTTAATHAAATNIYRYAIPDDILFLTKEIATLMLNKAKSGYQGRTGNDQGVIFYNDAFPKADIERVKEAYSIKRVG